MNERQILGTLEARCSVISQLVPGKVSSAPKREVYVGSSPSPTNRPDSNRLNSIKGVLRKLGVCGCSNTSKFQQNGNNLETSPILAVFGHTQLCP